MALRLVDVGIPTFVWKTKRIVCLNFQNENEDFENNINSKEKITSKKRYNSRDDHQSNLENFREIIRKIPASSGKLVIATKISGDFKILNVFSSDFDLREDFKTSSKNVNGVVLDRYNWLKNLTKEEGCSSIIFLLAKA